MNSGEVYFALRGASLDPSAVTTALGILPTRTLVKGEPRPKISTWELSAGKVSEQVVDVYRLSDDLVGMLADHAAAIREVAADQRADVVLQVVLTISQDERMSTPAIGFSKAVISFLASVGASIDIDTYRGAVQLCVQADR